MCDNVACFYLAKCNRCQQGLQLPAAFQRKAHSAIACKQHKSKFNWWTKTKQKKSLSIITVQGWRFYFSLRTPHQKCSSRSLLTISAQTSHTVVPRRPACSDQNNKHTVAKTKGWASSPNHQSPPGPPWYQAGLRGGRGLWNTR